MVTGTHTSSVQPNLNRAVIVGCEAAAWWLRHRWGQLPLLAALIVGGLATAVSYIGGPLGAAGMAVAGSAASLLALAQNARVDPDVVSTLNQSD